MKTQTLTFNRDHLNAFANLSRDFNPLHMDPRYARRTPFGQQVVFGIAAVFRVLAISQKNRKFALKRLAADFRGPLFLGENYQLSIENKPNSDSTLATIQLGNVVKTQIVCEVETKSEDTEFQQGKLRYIEGGSCEVSLKELHPFEKTFDFKAGQMPWSQFEALLWSSYSVGMVYPGPQALFTKIEAYFHSENDESQGLNFDQIRNSTHPVFKWIEIEASGPGIPSIKLSALDRPSPVDYKLEDFESTPEEIRLWKSKKILITGGSRGFGSALGLKLSKCGASVHFFYKKSETEAKRLEDSARLKDYQLFGSPCDLEDPESIKKWIQKNQASVKDLNTVFLNATPSIRRIGFLNQTSEERMKFIQQSILMQTHLISELLPLTPSGCAWVFVSTDYLTEAPAQFTHYLMAKGAIESMMLGLSREFPKQKFLSIRAPRMKTDQTQVPLGPEGESCVTVVDRFLDSCSKESSL